MGTGIPLFSKTNLDSSPGGKISGVVAHGRKIPNENSIHALSP
jgi:hypothetical protein